MVAPVGSVSLVGAAVVELDALDVLGSVEVVLDVTVEDDEDDEVEPDDSISGSAGVPQATVSPVIHRYRRIVGNAKAPERWFPPDAFDALLARERLRTCVSRCGS